jgi:hypothetical protein
MAFLPTTLTALRYWNIARQRYCRRLARYRNTLRVSADPVAKPAAHTRAESRGSRPSKPDAGERRTLRWREMDSNPRSPVSLRALERIGKRLGLIDGCARPPVLFPQSDHDRTAPVVRRRGFRGPVARERGRCHRRLRTAPLSAGGRLRRAEIRPDRLESAPDRPGDSRHGRPPLCLEIVDRIRADRSGRRELCDRPAKLGARRAALGGGDHRVRACRPGAKAGHCHNGVCFTTPAYKSLPDKISSAILPGANKDVVKPVMPHDQNRRRWRSAKSRCGSADSSHRPKKTTWRRSRMTPTWLVPPGRSGNSTLLQDTSPPLDTREQARGGSHSRALSAAPSSLGSPTVDG